MRLPLARPEPRRLAALGVVAVLAVPAVGVAVRRNGPARRPLPAVVDLSPVAVRRLVVDAGGRKAELTRHSRGWTASPGTPPQSAPLLLTAEDELFPMLAYRALRADAADPQYGLVDAVALVRLEDHAGKVTSLRVGGASFTGAGFYAHRDGDAGRVFLVPRNTIDLLRSLATGERRSSADRLQDRAERFQAEQEQAAREKGVSTYLRQAVDAGGQMPPPPP